MEFKILDAPVISGNIYTIIPATPAEGLVWDLSELNSQGIIKVTFPTGIDEHGTLKNVNLYPNPVTSYVFIRTGNPFSRATVRIHTMNGRLVYTGDNLSGNELKLDIHHLDPGIYIIQVTDQEKYFVRKIVITNTANNP